MTKRNTRGIGSNHILSKGLGDRHTCDSDPVTLDSGDPGIRNIRNRITSYSPTQGNFEVSAVSYGSQSDFCPVGATVGKSLYSIRFTGQITFDGTSYDAGSQYNIIVVLTDTNFNISKKFLIKPSTSGDMYCSNHILSSTGEVYIAISCRPNPQPASSTNVNFELYNSDGTLGNTITCHFKTSTTNFCSSSIIVKYDSNGDHVWSSEFAYSWGGTTAGSRPLVNNMALSPDETKLIINGEIGWTNSAISNSHFYILPDIHGTTYSAYIYLIDRAYVRMVVDPSNCNIIDIVYSRAPGGATTDYILSATPLPSKFFYKENDMIPVALAQVAQGTLGTIMNWDISGSNHPLLDNYVTGLGTGFGVLGATDLSGNVKYMYEIVPRYNSTSYPPNGSATPSVHPVALTDRSCVFAFHDVYNSWTNRNWARRSGSQNSPSDVLTQFTSGREGGNGAIGGYTTLITRLDENLSTPTAPTVKWSMVYGPSPTSSNSDASSNHYMVRGMEIDETNNYIFALFYARSTEWWNGSAYINACPTYGKTVTSLLAMNLSLTDGSNNWYRIIETSGTFNGFGLTTTNDRSHIYVNISWQGNLILATGTPEETTYDNGGKYSSAIFKFDYHTGDYVGMDYLITSSDGIHTVYNMYNESMGTL